MSRRKITEEAEAKQEEIEESETESTAGDQANERTQLTQRMPDDLLDDVDTLAEELGMSRNAAINMLVKRGLDEF